MGVALKRSILIWPYPVSSPQTDARLQNGNMQMMCISRKRLTPAKQDTAASSHWRGNAIIATMPQRLQIFSRIGEEQPMWAWGSRWLSVWLWIVLSAWSMEPHEEELCQTVSTSKFSCSEVQEYRGKSIIQLNSTYVQLGDIFELVSWVHEAHAKLNESVYYKISSSFCERVQCENYLGDH